MVLGPQSQIRCSFLIGFGVEYASVDELAVEIGSSKLVGKICAHDYVFASVRVHFQAL